LLTKLNFPREALIMAGFVQLAVGVFISLLVVIPVLFYYKIVPGFMLILFPMAVLLTVLFGYSLGLLITPFAVFFTDIRQAIPLLARFWFFMTPVIYPPPTEGVIAVIARFNPVSPLLMVSRDLLTGHAVRMLPQFWVVTAATFVFLFVGFLMYRLAMPHAIERMSA
jgi:lipopolysaccharide transport system permease protein